jgi:glycosyltransferase involved in cell wall biosynthesis
VKVLHVPYSFLPDPPGGTEIYVDGLCRELRWRGVESVVAAPGDRDARYQVHDLEVWRFACASTSASLDAIYGAGDAIATAAFARVLDEARPDVLHQHALSPACSVELVTLARGRGIPTVFTYHTPTVSCQRGTLLRMGSDECAGEVDVETCTACVLDDLGLNPLMRRVVGAVPAEVGRSLGRRGVGGGVWTALRMRALMEGRAQRLHELFTLVDRFVAPSPWVEHLLRRNGVSSDRILLSLHGTDVDMQAPAAQAPHAGIRLAHLGRVDPAKGTAVLLRAIASEPSAALTLDVYGIVQHGADPGLFDTLKTIAGGDARVRFLRPVPHDEVSARLADYDAVVVPSQWMETGPLVVLEAFAAGVPVIGSALGGIRDKIDHEVNGLLVSPCHSDSAWAETLLRCASEPDLLRRLKAGVRRPRTMHDVGEEMAALYADVTSRLAVAR